MSHVKGLDELLANLKALDRDVKKEARIAASAGARIIKAEAIILAQGHGLVDSGALLRNIAIAKQRGTPLNIIEYHIGVRHGPEIKGAQRFAVRRASNGKIRYEWTNNPFYWWFWEFGHYNTLLKRHVAPKPFIGPALTSKQGEVMDAIRYKMASRIEKFSAPRL